MEKMRPQPVPIKEDIVNLGVKISLSKAFGAMKNPDAAKEFEEKSFELGGRILDRVQTFKHNYAEIYFALRDLKKDDPDMHAQVVHVLHQVQRERMPVKIPEPRKSMHEVYSRELVKA